MAERGCCCWWQPGENIPPPGVDQPKKKKLVHPWGGLMLSHKIAAKYRNIVDKRSSLRSAILF